MTWFSLLPNARTPLSSLAGAPLTGSTRRRIALGVEIRADGSPVPGEPRAGVSAEVFSAGDVIGLDPRMIARVDPPQGATGFEPNYFPFVEFVDADFPWRYSLDLAAGARIRPWLVLLALKPAEFEFLDQGAAPLPRIRIGNPAATLPSLAQSWAYAHVHVAHGAARSNDLAGLIASNPAAHVSRLMCLRQLDADTAYTLVLVPATEAGRVAGLGLDEQPDPFDRPAWDGTTAPGLELPVYFQSRFITSVMEDFEILARRLSPFIIDAESTTALPVEASAGDPGYYPGYAKPGATFEMQDALMRVDRTVEPYNTDPALAALLKPTLESVIEGERVAPGDDGPDREDPLVAMPAYGWRFRRQTTVDAGRAAAGDPVDRVNLDLKFRHAASLGADVVRRNQEHFSRICWSQYREIAAANQAIARLRLARELAARMVTRRFDRLPAALAAALSEPVHRVATLAGDTTPAGLLADAGVPASFASRALLRISSKRAMRAPGAADARLPRVVSPTPLLPGSEPRVAIPADPRTPGRRPRRPATVALALRPDAQRLVTELFGGRDLLGEVAAPVSGVAVHPVAVASVVAAASRLLVELPQLKAGKVLHGLGEREVQRMDPIMRAPVVSDPLVEALRTIHPQALLRSLDALPNNVVLTLKENRALVEGFLMGANHEMNAELRWREFPTDMRGTIFRRFWNRMRAPDDPAGDDIPEIHRWTASLGSNFPAHDADRREALVLLVRGDLIRKFGMILAVLNRATSNRFVRGEGTDHAPIFAGRIGIDTCYFGFDVNRDDVLAQLNRHFFVLFETPGRVRFGLDAASAAVRRARFQPTRAALRFPLAALGRTAASTRLPAHLVSAAGGAVPASAATWDELSWQHVLVDASGHLDVVRTNPGVPEAPNYWKGDRDAATIARSFWQKPIAAVVPAARVLR